MKHGKIIGQNIFLITTTIYQLPSCSKFLAHQKCPMPPSPCNHKNSIILQPLYVPRMYDVKTRQSLINCIEKKKLLKTKNWYSDNHPIKFFTSERNFFSSISALVSMICLISGWGTANGVWCLQCCAAQCLTSRSEEASGNVDAWYLLNSITWTPSSWPTLSY